GSGGSGAALGSGGSGAALGSGGSGAALGSGGDGGAVVLGDQLTLDPESLTFFGLPIGSIRWAVAGYDAAHRTCVTVTWDFSSDTRGLGPFCDGYNQQSLFPYTNVVTDTDGPCTDWDYGGNVETTAFTGCVDFAESGLSSMDLADFTVTVAGDPFSGTITVDNRPPGTVTFGLEYLTDIDQDVFVETVDGMPTWLRLSKDGEPVELFSTCGLFVCGVDVDPVPCEALWNDVTNITQGTTEGSVYFNWDGRLWQLDPDGECYEEKTAEPGTYQAEVCYGFTTEPASVGVKVADPVCVTRGFTYPTDAVRITEDVSG
ncbi:MAG: hypothetical protein JW751_17830, partial [Polyangiaceae bacterium]|nr:hypothetical protein [Polyangiaceae bacterium]